MIDNGFIAGNNGAGEIVDLRQAPPARRTAPVAKCGSQQPTQRDPRGRPQAALQLKDIKSQQMTPKPPLPSVEH